MTPMNGWRPSGKLATLRLRAAQLAAARRFMAERNILEVETPVLSTHTATDPWLASLHIDGPQATRWLRTSPEHHMKRMLAAGYPDIYQLAKVFRADAPGRHHQPEFTMLEWYRHDFDGPAIIAETCELITALAACTHCKLTAPLLLPYCATVVAAAGVDPITATLAELIECARELRGWREELRAELGTTRAVWLDLIVSHAVLPNLPHEQLIVLHDYPVEQALLAKARPDDPRLAERFEVLLNGLELANGYVELQDPVEQRERAAADNTQRVELGSPAVAVDDALLTALEAGLPACAGVAVGIDRVVMATQNLATIDDAISFPTGQ